MHLSVDKATGEVLAVRVTEAAAADGPQLPELVLQSQQTGGPVRQASADGAFDSWADDAFLSEQGIVSTIPPRKGSKIRQHGNCRKAPLQCDRFWTRKSCFSSPCRTEFDAGSAPWVDYRYCRRAGRP